MKSYGPGYHQPRRRPRPDRPPRNNGHPPEDALAALERGDDRHYSDHRYRDEFHPPRGRVEIATRWPDLAVMVFAALPGSVVMFVLVIAAVHMTRLFWAEGSALVLAGSWVPLPLTAGALAVWPLVLCLAWSSLEGLYRGIEPGEVARRRRQVALVVGVVVALLIYLLAPQLLAPRP